MQKILNDIANKRGEGESDESSDSDEYAELEQGNAGYGKKTHFINPARNNMPLF